MKRQTVFHQRLKHVVGCTSRQYREHCKATRHILAYAVCADVLGVHAGSMHGELGGPLRYLLLRVLQQSKQVKYEVLFSTHDTGVCKGHLLPYAACADMLGVHAGCVHGQVQGQLRQRLLRVL